MSLVPSVIPDVSRRIDKSFVGEASATDQMIVLNFSELILCYSVVEHRERIRGYEIAVKHVGYMLLSREPSQLCL